METEDASLLWVVGARRVGVTDGVGDVYGGDGRRVDSGVLVSLWKIGRWNRSRVAGVGARVSLWDAADDLLGVHVLLVGGVEGKSVAGSVVWLAIGLISVVTRVVSVISARRHLCLGIVLLLGGGLHGILLLTRIVEGMTVVRGSVVCHACRQGNGSVRLWVVVWYIHPR